MLRFLLAGLVSLALTLPVAASPLAGDKTYDMLFRNGTLDDIDRDKELVYARKVTNKLKPEAEARDTGDIAIGFRDGATELATLEFRRDGKHRSLGSFPANVGNPMIMYFYETVVRDMAEAAGGSPFYIRNRVKDALIQTSARRCSTGRPSPPKPSGFIPSRTIPMPRRCRGSAIWNCA